MNLITLLKESIIRSKHHLRSNDLESIIWLVNIFPSLAGFSILKDTISAPFWILHISLLLYVYLTGSITYQIHEAEGASDFIKSNLNIILLTFIVSDTHWFLKKRPLLKTVLDQVILNDQLSMETDFLKKKHEKLLSVIKYILFIFYGFNIVDSVLIYLPHRTATSTAYYSMTPCVGIEPLTVSPNREICQVILLTQEVVIMTVVLNYQALLLFLIAHTASMYQMLSAEMMALDDYEDWPESKVKVKERLPVIIARHVLILDITKKLKALYSMPIGIDFAANAICMSLIIYLPVYEWVTFMPILIYCFLVFFLYCFLCQRLVNDSEDFVDAVYSCGWEKFDVNEQKTICIMLLQAQKSISLLAADIIPVNISTFATTLQAMYKFITVVKF